MTFTVGCTVRVPCRSNEAKDMFTRMAVVSTINKDATGQKVASIIVEDPTPRALTTDRACNSTITTRRNDNNNNPFLIAPNFTAQQDKSYTDEEYDDIPLSSIQPLLPFEIDGQPEPTTQSTRTCERQTIAETQKTRGDALLHLRDPSAAVAYYENALSATSTLHLGGTIVVKRNERPVLAEIDCIEDDHGDDNGGCCRSFDVTFVADGAEGTVLERDVLLGVWEGGGDGSDRRLQERILLNLARCCLYLAEIDTRHGRSSTRSSRYRRSAILASSLVIACAEFFEEGGVPVSSGVSSKTKARLLRARAYVGIGKEGHAKADLRIVLREDSDCADAKRLLSSLERARSVKKKTDRKLAKEMCTWIDAATNLAPVNENDEEGIHTADEHKENTATEEKTEVNSYGWMILVLMLSYWIKGFLK